MVHADSSAILQAEGFLLYLYWPLIVTLLRVQDLNFDMMIGLDVKVSSQTKESHQSGQLFGQALALFAYHIMRQLSLFGVVFYEMTQNYFIQIIFLAAQLIKK